MAKVGRKTRKVLMTVEPELWEVVIKALMAAPPWLDFAVISGKRTKQEQWKLWLQGRDETGEFIVDPAKVVTHRDGYAKKSTHQTGEAIDVVAYVDGKADWSQVAMAAVAGYIIGFARARGVALTGGLKWKWDRGHLQLENGQ